MKKRDQLLKQSLKSGLAIDQQKCTTLRNKVINRLRQAKAKFFIDTIEEARGNGEKDMANHQQAEWQKTES